jgi:hypothetical protein
VIAGLALAACPEWTTYAQAPRKHWEIKFIKAGGWAKLKIGGANGRLLKFSGHGAEGITWTRDDRSDTMDITQFTDANATEIVLYAELSTKDGEGELVLSIEVRYDGEVVESWNVLKKEDIHTFKRKS